MAFPPACYPHGSSLPPAGYVGPLDAVAGKVLAAYGMFRLFAANAEGVNVRRSSDSAAADVGTLATGEFDAATFSAFVGGGSGYAAMVYDQKGGCDLIQATAGLQPRIDLAGINAKPALKFGQSGGERIKSAGNLSWAGTWDAGCEFWYLMRPTNIAGSPYQAAGSRGGGKPELFIRSAGISQPCVFSGAFYRFATVLSDNTNYVLRFYYTGGTWYCDVNGVTDANSFALAKPSFSELDDNYALGWDGAAGDFLQGQMMFSAICSPSLTSGEAAALTAALKTLGGIA